MNSDATGAEPMNTDAGQALRDICGDYYHGLLAREAYRRQRAELLNKAILGQRLPVPSRAAPLPFGAATPAAGAQTTQKSPPMKPAAPGQRLLALAIAAVVGVVATAALAWWLTADAPTAPPAPTVSDRDIAPLEAPAPVATQRENFVKLFLDGKQAWTAAGVSRFLYEWERLTEIEKQGLVSTPEFERFRSELRERVKDERALGSTLETGETLENFASLLDLDLGLPPREPKAVAPTTQPQPPAVR